MEPVEFTRAHYRPIGSQHCLLVSPARTHRIAMWGEG